MSSRDNSVISQPDQIIVDTYGTTWSIIGDQVAADGIVDVSTNRVTQLAFANGKIWQENTDNLWWSKGGSYDTLWSPDGGSPTNPLPQSPDNSIVSQPDQFLVDASGTTWTIVKGQVAVNGIIDASTNRVTELAYETGTVWQENTDNLWWSKNPATNTWDPPGGTATSPVHSGNQVWFGGNGPFDTAADWSGGSVPQAGDNAVIARGTVIIGAVGAPGVNFAFQSVPGQATPTQNPTLEFNSAGSYSIGTVQTSVNSEIRLDASSGGAIPNLTIAGIHSSASQLSILEYQGKAVVINGDSSLTDGASLSVRGFNGFRPPLSHIENDGTMRIDASSAFLGALSGQGAVRVTNDGNVSITSATAGETIQLPSGHLNIVNSSSSPTSPPFLAGITDFGANSSINLGDAQVLATQNPREVFVKSGPTAGELFVYEGSSKMVDLHISGQSNIYASSGVGSGSVLLTAYDTGHSFPIATS